MPSFDPISGSTSESQSSFTPYQREYHSAKALRRTGSPLKDMYLWTSGRCASRDSRSITEGCGGRSGLPIASLMICRPVAASISAISRSRREK